MAVLQKQVLDVRLLGLDEKANPRTSQPGTIVDGRNWTMNKEGRIEKRPGMSALAMLDTAGNAVSLPRELSALGDELVISNARKMYARNPISGEWIPRGYSAYERMDIMPALATTAECNGIDSRLQMDSAQIGRYVLTWASCVDGTADGDAIKSGWFLTDSTTGETLVPLQALSALGVHVGTDGAAGTQTFVAFCCIGASIVAAVWDSSTAYKAVLGTATIASDVDTTVDPNIYTLTTNGAASAPYAVVRVAANIWLVAYKQTSSQNVVVRKVTRTSDYSFTISAAATDGTVFNITAAMAFGWAYTSGATAHLVACGTNILGGAAVINYWPVTVSTGAVGSGVVPTPTGWVSCRGVTGVVLGATPYFFFDIIKTDGTRNVYLWSGGLDAILVVADAGLLTQAYLPTVGDSDEIGLGIAYLSTWQPSAFLIRLHVYLGAPTVFTVGAHLQNGNFAGRAMSQHLPNGGGPLALGILNNPTSLGGSGTVLTALAYLSPPTHATVSPPCEIGDTLLLPGAALKAYDGVHVTEAAFPLGPESISAVESTGGIFFNVTTAGGLTSSLAPSVDSDLTATFATQSGQSVAAIEIDSPPGSPGLTVFAAGTAVYDIWVKVSNPTGGVTYTLSYGGEMALLLYKKSAGGAYQGWQSSSSPSTTILTTSWQHVTLSIPVSLLSSAVTDVVAMFVNAGASSLTGNGAVLHVSTGPTMPATLTTPLPVLELGTREYCALASWTDAKGRIQRSQICLPSPVATNNGLANSVTVPMVNITERDMMTNLDAAISPAQIEIYRTQVSDSIFRRVAVVTNVVNGANVTVTDRLADTAIAANEQLYTTGGVVENWPTVGCNLVASHQGRAFVATSDNQVFFSAYNQSGEGLAFAAEYQVETEHVRGALTALLSLDDKLVVATATAYAVLAGIGPEATGLPSYDSPILVGSGIGPLSQRACARMPSGVVMVTAHGAQMFDRGLSLTYVGIQAETDIPGSVSWYAAAFHPGKNQVRLFADSLATVYDWTLSGPPGRASQFFKWTYSTTIVAAVCASSLLYMLGSDGVVYLADVGTSDAGTAYQEYVQLSVVSPVGVNAWGRIYAMRLACTIAASGVLKVVFTSEENNLSSTDTNTITAPAGGLQHVIAKPRYGKCSSMTIWIGENAASTGAGVTIDAIGLLVGNKGGLGRLPAASRLARS